MYIESEYLQEQSFDLTILWYTQFVILVLLISGSSMVVIPITFKRLYKHIIIYCNINKYYCYEYEYFKLHVCSIE